MKIWLALIISMVFFGHSAEADTYHRFWRGMKRENLSWDQFQAGLNRVFIPATVQTGSGKGMAAYQPILLEGLKGLPDEVALVSYSDLAAYNSLYATASGKAYQGLHWSYFDQTTSHSVVPTAFSGSVAVERAYDLQPSYDDWMKNSTTVLIFFRGSEEASVDFLKRAQNHLSSALTNDPLCGIFDRVALISQNYWIEYVSTSTVLSSGNGADLVIPVQNEAPDKAQINLYEGVNLQF